MRFLIAAALSTLSLATNAFAVPVGPEKIEATGYSHWGAGYADAGNELTDGIIPNRHYASYENNGSYGEPYVGWTSSPTITFTFDGAQTFGRLIVWADDFSGSWGVTAPAAVSATIGDVVYSSFYRGRPLDADFTYPVNYNGSRAPGGGTPYILDLTGAVGDTVELHVTRGGQWTFLSEVEFFSPTPEPASWAMMLGGFGAVGAAIRRRRKADVRVA